MEHDAGGEFFGRGGRRGGVHGENDAPTSREVLDEDLTGGECLEFGDEFLQVERNKPFFLRRVSS